MKDKKRSILRICILHFTLFSLIILAVFFTAMHFYNSFFQDSMPTIDDVMKYEDTLKAENYLSIPKGVLKNGSLAVFDENDKLLFTTSDELNELFNTAEIRFASDTYNGIWFNVVKFNEQDGDRYAIIKSRYDYDHKMDVVIDYCITDSNYNILEGNLFSDIGTLTKEEFEMLSNGSLSGKKYIEKATFTTNDGKSRSLAIITPMGDQNYYRKAQQKANMVWAVTVPLLLLLIALETRFFVSRIKKTFYPIDEAVRDFEKNRRFKIKYSEVPSELESMVYDFNELIDNLNYEKEKNEKEYKEKQRVFANLSHDLRTPLTVIQGYSKAFIDGVVPSEKAGQYMTAIYNRVTDAANTMDSLYEYSKVNHPDYQTDIQTGDICEFCKEYLAEKYSDLEFQGYNLEFNIPEGKINFEFDETLMKRLFNNIIGNSIKYNEPGTTIYFSLISKSNEIIFTLGDNGVGMPENIIEDAFKPFVTGDESRTGESGTGLGLAIAKSVVNIHNGRMRIVYPPIFPYKTQINIIFSK